MGNQINGLSFTNFFFYWFNKANTTEYKITSSFHFTFTRFECLCFGKLLSTNWMLFFSPSLLSLVKYLWKWKRQLINDCMIIEIWKSVSFVTVVDFSVLACLLMFLSHFFSSFFRFDRNIYSWLADRTALNPIIAL